MIQFERTVKVSSKGQITLPKPVRDLLGSDWVRVVIDGDTVHLERAPEVAGSLRQYAQRYIPTSEAVEQAWSRVQDPGLDDSGNGPGACVPSRLNGVWVGNTSPGDEQRCRALDRRRRRVTLFAYQLTGDAQAQLVVHGLVDQ
jgi:AbrB family looped-hinge helix DNA binding protein